MYRETKRAFVPFRNRKFSIQKRMMHYMALIFLVFFILTVLMSFIYTRSLVSSNYRSIHDTMELYNATLTDSLQAVESCLYQYASVNLDVGFLSTLKDDPDIYNYQVRVHNQLNESIEYIQNVSGIFVFAPRTNSFISSRFSFSSYPCYLYLKETMRDAASGGADESLNLISWDFVEIEGQYYLIRIIKNKYCYLGAWTSMNTLTESFQNLNSMGTTFLFSDENGELLTDSDWSADTLQPKAHLGRAVTVRRNDRESFLQITTKLDFCGHYLIALVPMEEITRSMLPFYYGEFLLILLLLVLIGCVLLPLRKFLSAPMTSLQHAATSVREGSFDRLLDVDQEKCKEVLEINEAINSLISEITNLRIQSYETALSEKEIELQILKYQITPHFLINCLSTISSMQGMTDGPMLSQKMTASLSEHLRYTMGNRTKVSVAKEVHYVRNYLELTSLRFPGCLRYELNIPDECRNASVFPFILLMMTENSIKYNMVMGEHLLIRISACLEHSSDASGNELTRVHLIHVDSGDGYKEQDLLKLNRILANIDEPIIEHADGRRLGVYNVIKRLFLIFGDRASIQFTNEPGMGARIDTWIPYEEYIEDTPAIHGEKE